MKGIRHHLRRNLAVYLVLLLATSSVVTASSVTTGAGVRKNSVGSRQVKNDSLTGEDINEQTLKVGSIIARARGNTPQATTAVDTDYPMTNATFVQEAGEIMSEFIVRFKFDSPVVMTCDPTFEVARIKFGIEGVGFADGPSIFFGPVVQTDKVSSVRIPFLLFEDAVATTRVIKVQIGDLCTDAGAAATIESVEVDAIGIR